LAQALGSSLNVPAVRALHQIGVDDFLDFLAKLRQKMGDDGWQKDRQIYTSEQLGLSVALGTHPFSPWEFANLWRVFLGSGAEATEGSLQLIQKADEIVKILADNQNRLLSFGLENNLDVP